MIVSSSNGIIAVRSLNAKSQSASLTIKNLEKFYLLVIIRQKNVREFGSLWPSKLLG
jgi:hypothetical protein